MSKALSPLQQRILSEAAKVGTIKTGFVLDTIMQRRDRAARIIVSKSFRRLERRRLIHRWHYPQPGKLPEAETEILDAINYLAMFLMKLRATAPTHAGE
jgi:hypothetical protein